jgi:hypothetical protein
MHLLLDVRGVNCAYSGGAIQKGRPAMKQFPTPDITFNVKTLDNIYWPDEAQLADLVKQGTLAETSIRKNQADPLVEDNSQYAALYFVA